MALTRTAAKWPLSAISSAQLAGVTTLGAWVTVVQGVVFVVCVLAFRRGIIGEIAHVIKKPL